MFIMPLTSFGASPSTVSTDRICRFPLLTVFLYDQRLLTLETWCSYEYRQYRSIFIYLNLLVVCLLYFLIKWKQKTIKFLFVYLLDELFTPEYTSSANVRLIVWDVLNTRYISKYIWINKHKHRTPTLFPNKGTWKSVAFSKCRSTLFRR